jgi:hypothetical protein
MANESTTKRECSEFICERVATVYAGGPYSGDWADYYCNDHIPTGYRVWDKLAPVCPSCDGFIPNNETPGAYMGAISRKDNKTEICSACGTAEALADFFSNT